MIHFEAAEFAARKARTLAAMAQAGLDGLLLFRQETMYWLTGYDSFGYVFFQCLHLAADGSMVLLTRAPDLRQAELTSILSDVRVWVDGEDADPAAALRAILAERGGRGARLGVEYEAYGLTAANGMRLAAALEGFCTLADASLLVSRLRVVKSAAEIACVRRAAALADDVLEAAAAQARPGADEGRILAAMMGALYAGGGDSPGNPYIIGSGREAMLVRSHSGRRVLGAADQLTLEFAGVWRHYHACLMRTIPIGPLPERQRAMQTVALDAMAACLEAMRPGRPLGAVFAAHARVVDGAGMRGLRLNACGYSLGTTFAPNWMDWPMIHAGSEVVIEPGMVFFLHMILMDTEAGLAMMPGQTVLVGPAGCELLSRHRLGLPG